MAVRITEYQVDPRAQHGAARALLASMFFRHRHPFLVGLDLLPPHGRPRVGNIDTRAARASGSVRCPTGRVSFQFIAHRRASQRLTVGSWVRPPARGGTPAVLLHLWAGRDSIPDSIPIEGGVMTQTQLLKRLHRAHWRALQRLGKAAYLDGLLAGLGSAHGEGPC